MYIRKKAHTLEKLQHPYVLR